MKKNKGSGANFIDRKGERFGRWLVLERTPQIKKVRWICRCDCGTIREVSASDLQSGHTNSCGCLAKDKTKTRRESSIYLNFKKEKNSWTGMKQRCLYPAHIEYHRYGGRGIKVCERWLNSFKNFLEDMGPRPEGCSLDRINLDGDYTPDNCKWSTKAEQSRNSSRNVNVLYDGKEFTLKELANHLGLNYYSLHGYYRRRKKPLMEALSLASKI